MRPKFPIKPILLGRASQPILACIGGLAPKGDIGANCRMAPLKDISEHVYIHSCDGHSNQQADLAEWIHKKGQAVVQ